MKTQNSNTSSNFLNPTFLIAAGTLILALLGMRFLTSGWEWAFSKEAVPLRKPLDEMPTRIGPYELVASERMEPGIEKSLGTTEYVSNLYRDTRLSPGTPGSAIRLHAVYYTGNQEPVSAAHVPEICYAANGNESIDIRKIDVEIPFPASTESETANMLLLENQAGEQTALPSETTVPMREYEYMAPGSNQSSSVLYFFIYNGKYIASRKDITLQFMDRSSKTVYYCKVEIAPGSLTRSSLGNRGGFVPMEGDVEQARALAGSFLRWVLPEMFTCLPTLQEAE